MEGKNGWIIVRTFRIGIGQSENMDIYKNEEKEKQKKEAAVQKVRRRI